MSMVRDMGRDALWRRYPQFSQQLMYYDNEPPLPGSILSRAPRRKPLTKRSVAGAVQCYYVPCRPLPIALIASAQAFWHCPANCIQNCIGFIAAGGKASAFGALPAGLKPGKDFSFDSIADEAVIGLGDLICSSQASIM